MGLRTGSEYIAALNDGRQIYHNGECLEDVAKAPVFRRQAAWAEVTCGLLGRSPDYMNAMITSFAGVAMRASGQDRELAKPTVDLYLMARREDHYWTHTFHYPCLLYTS